MSRIPFPLSPEKHSHLSVLRVLKVLSVRDIPLNHYQLATLQLELIYQSSPSEETEQQGMGHGDDF